jgi:hypothetical protein
MTHQRKPIYTLYYSQFLPALGKPAFRAQCVQKLTLARRMAKNAACICDLRHPSGLRVGYLVPDPGVPLATVTGLMLAVPS